MSDLVRMQETLLQLYDIEKKDTLELKDVFVDSPRLILTLNNNCYGNCLHCIADCTPRGKVIPIDKFTSIDPEFFKLFNSVDFGRRGDPLIYSSENKDLGDIISYLTQFDIKKYTLALALHPEKIDVMKKIEELKETKELNIETMVTYHHYYKNFCPQQYAKVFNKTLKNYAGFSDKIIISLLADDFSQDGKTMENEVQETFNLKKSTLFQDIDLQAIDEETFKANFNNNEFGLFITPINTMLFPLGRFRNYLSQRNILEQYSKRFYEGLSDYFCPDLIRWPGIIIEPDGSLNTCGSFEAICSCKAVVSNIIDRSYQQVQEDLLYLHNREKEWFKQNIISLMQGKACACKMKNNCYTA